MKNYEYEKYLTLVKANILKACEEKISMEDFQNILDSNEFEKIYDLKLDELNLDLPNDDFHIEFI